MLRTRSIFVVILCIWTSFQAGIAEDAPVAGAAADGPDLSLQEAVDRALAHNLGLMISRYQPANAFDDVVIEESAFDFQLFGSTSTSESRSAARTSALDDAPTPQSENRRARVGTDKLFSTGATVTLDSSINRSASNNNAARNPDYSSDIGLSLRQPLLRDAWARVNLAPLARARAGAEQSVFQLRSDALDVILETEIAYWNLAFARANYALVASSIELAETLLEENRERERLGLVTPLEVLQAETELTNQQEDLIQAERAIEDAEDNLRRLMGGTSFQSPVED
ncbi:MAG: TolC family protein, partial [Verrucomicrobiota bacterium]